MPLLNSIRKFNDMPPGVAVDRLLRRLILRRWQNRTSVTVSCNKQKTKLQIRRKSTDAEVVWQCFLARQYKVPVVVGASPLHREAIQTKYESIARSGKKPLIVDCGANIGASTVWFKMTYPEAEIVAIEPAPDNFSLLVANTARFGGINAIEAGIGPNDTTAFLQDNGGGACGYRTGTDETSLKIDIISLKTILEAEKFKDYVPFILKIDIEGAEKDLFERHPFASFDCFPVLIFESHDFCMPGLKTSSPFFRFHADSGRDFLFGMENVFSIDMNSVLDRETV
jgi:FkbM family methyltransferase